MIECIGVFRPQIIIRTQCHCNNETEVHIFFLVWERAHKYRILSADISASFYHNCFWNISKTSIDLKLCTHTQIAQVNNINQILIGILRRDICYRKQHASVDFIKFGPITWKNINFVYQMYVHCSDRSFLFFLVFLARVLATLLRRDFVWTDSETPFSVLLSANSPIQCQYG